MADAETQTLSQADPQASPPAGASPAAPAEVHEHDPVHAVAHPQPSAYVVVGLILAIVTAAEVGLFYLEDVSETLITLALVVLMVIKFSLVALWFMHLKFDARIFRRLFVGGIVLALSVYAIVLAASHVFAFLV